MTQPMPRRRRPWGALFADAPWDGRARAETPVRIPATVAARLPADPAPDAPAGPAPTTPRARKRFPLGRLLAAAPWAGPRPAAPAPAPEYATL